MPVVVESCRALHQKGVLAGQGGVLDRDAPGGLVVKVFAGPFAVIKVIPRGGAVFYAAGTAFSEERPVQDLPAHDLPGNVCGRTGYGESLAVEADVSRSPDKVQQRAFFHGFEIYLHDCRVPGRAAQRLSFMNRRDRNDRIVERLVVIVIYTLVNQIIRNETGQHQGVVELAFRKGGLVTEPGLIAEFETRGGVGVWREALVALHRPQLIRSKGFQAFPAEGGKSHVCLEHIRKGLPHLFVGGIVHHLGRKKHSIQAENRLPACLYDLIKVVRSLNHE